MTVYACQTDGSTLALLVFPKLIDGTHRGNTILDIGIVENDSIGLLGLLLHLSAQIMPVPRIKLPDSCRAYWNVRPKRDTSDLIRVGVDIFDVYLY